MFGVGFMKAEDIRSADDLEAWLDGLPEDQVLQVAPQIAHRAALRLLPVWAAYWSNFNHETTSGVSVFRCHLLCAVALHDRDADLDFEMFNAKSTWQAAASHAMASFKHVAERDSNHSMTENSKHFAKVASKAAEHAGISVSIVRRVIRREATIVFSAATLGAAEAALMADIAAWERGSSPLDRSLFPPKNDSMQRTWADAAPLFERHPAWQVFKDLYENTLHARPQNWHLLTALAQKDEAFWTGTDREILDRIAGVMEEFAVAATYNGERVELNPETHKLRLAGEGSLPDDMGRYARRKMTRAVALFDDKLDNQYNPISDAVRVVRTAIEDIENIPMELFDACGTATRMVASLSKSETIPSPDQDALIGEFVHLVREVAADIAANDPKAQETVARRNSIEGNNALQVNAEVINFTVGQIVNVSEGALARELANNARNALETAPETEAARTGAFKLSSRVLRVHRVLREVGENIAAYKELYHFACVLIAHPQMQQALQAILRYLGLG